MKNVLSALVSLVLFVPGINAKIEFAGVFYIDGLGSFSLIDPDTGGKSGWVQEGQSFQGYQIRSFDREKGILTLRSANDQLFLTLRASRVQAERITIRGKLKIGAGKDLEIEDAILVIGEESRFPIDENRWLRVAVETMQHRRQDSAPVTMYVYTMAFEELDENGEPLLLSAPRVTALPGHGFSIQSAQGTDTYSFSYEP